MISLLVVLSLASFFEQNGQLFLAAKYLTKAGDYGKALRFLMQLPEDGKAIDLAVDLVGIAKSDQLTTQLVSYLMGERDGIPKEAKYIFRLYLSMGKFVEAGKTAVMIASDEQAEGNNEAFY